MDKQQIYLHHLKNAILQNDTHRIKKYYSKLYNLKHQSSDEMDGGGIMDYLSGIFPFFGKSKNSFNEKELSKLPDSIKINKVIDWVIDKLLGKLKYKNYDYADSSRDTFINTGILYANVETIPSDKDIIKNGTSSQGLVNLMKLKINKQPPKYNPNKDLLGSYYDWIKYLNANSTEIKQKYEIKTLTEFNTFRSETFVVGEKNVSYWEKLPVGTLFYRNKNDASGNNDTMGILIKNDKIIFIDKIKGLIAKDAENIDDYLLSSFNKKTTYYNVNVHTYFTHYCLPENWLLQN